MSKLVYLKNVVTLQLDAAKCVGCGMCLQVCPHTVFSMDQDKVRVEDRDACMECGACAQNCPVEALFVETGVGCAAAVINAALGRTDGVCCDISGKRSSCC